MQIQPALFDEIIESPSEKKIARSGTFLDNMSLPVHRWFRYSAGFSASWVQNVLENWNIKPGMTVLDPFVGSGTVPLICDTLGVKSVGIEAHPFVNRICKAKLKWESDSCLVDEIAAKVLDNSKNQNVDLAKYPQLIHRSFSIETLAALHKLKTSWLSVQNNSSESELVWLALTAILRPTSQAGTAQWQYIQPNKTKKKVIDPYLAFKQQIHIIKSDLLWMQRNGEQSYAEIILGDARTFSNMVKSKIDAVITSPPYANNYDYADALRFEMTFWGEINGWGDLHDSVRKYLLVSSSQHSSHDKLKIEELIETDYLGPIRNDLHTVMCELAKEREKHGGKKHYDTMIGAYFRDISLVLHQLRRVCKEGASMCWVIGDSAPYGVYCPVDEWIGELAIAAGFKEYNFEKLRDRNIKWKNRKHRVPLKEGLLWIEG